MRGQPEALTASGICEENKQLILGFVRHKKVAENIGISRQTKYLHYLRIFAEILEKRFDEATIPDLEIYWRRHIIGQSRGEKPLKRLLNQLKETLA